MKTKVKICGLNSIQAVQAVVAQNADYAGFVFFPRSPRHLALEEAAHLKSLLPSTIQSVSVLVDPDDTVLAKVKQVLDPDYVQLHGKESPARVAEIKKNFPELKLIKAIAVRNGDDVAQAAGYMAADMLLFDAKAPEDALPGGNGMSFDWVLLKDRDFSKPWFLSGGLNAANVAEALVATGASAVDVSSGVESSPGVKDGALIEQFMKAAHNET